MNISLSQKIFRKLSFSILVSFGALFAEESIIESPKLLNAYEVGLNEKNVTWAAFLELQSPATGHDEAARKHMEKMKEVNAYDYEKKIRRNVPVFKIPTAYTLKPEDFLGSEGQEGAGGPFLTFQLRYRYLGVIQKDYLVPEAISFINRKKVEKEKTLSVYKYWKWNEPRKTGNGIQISTVFPELSKQKGAVSSLKGSTDDEGFFRISLFPIIQYYQGKLPASIEFQCSTPYGIVLVNVVLPPETVQALKRIAKQI